MLISGLYGSTTWESAEVDMVIDCMEDTIKPVMGFFFCKDEAKKVNATSTSVLNKNNSTLYYSRYNLYQFYVSLY